MATFSYTAKDMNGKTIKGTFEAANQNEVIGLIREKRCIPVEIREDRPKSKLNAEISFFDPKVKTKDLSLFCRQFAVTLRAGITVDESLDILKKQSTNKTLRRVVEKLHEDIQKGNSLSVAFAKEPKVFPSILVNMIESGEVSGNLDEVMDKMASHFEKENKINQKVKGAITYPAVIAIVAVLVITFLMIFVVPTFVEMFASFGSELPLPTRILIGISNAFRNYWYFIIFGIVTVVTIFRRFASTPEGRYRIDELKLKIPGFGELFTKMAMSRFASNLSVMLTSGVDIIQAVEVVEKVIGNEYIQKKLWNVKDSVRKGFGLGSSLAQNEAFPPLVYQMIEVGESSGTLDFVLEKVSDFYESEVDTAVGQLTTIIEPIIIVILGVVVAFIVVSMLLPMFDMYDLIA